MYGYSNQTKRRHDARREIDRTTTHHQGRRRLQRCRVRLVPIQNGSVKPGYDLFERHRSGADAEIRHREVIEPSES